MKYTPQNDNCLETALAALKRDTQSANRKLVARCSLGALSLLFAILGVGWLTAGRSAGIFPLSLALLCILLAAIPSPQPYQQAIDALLPIADARAIGPLLDVLTSAFDGKRKAILSVLIHLLPQVQDRDADLLLPAHRNQLRATLIAGDFQQEHTYLIAILKALERVGDHEDLALVTRIAIGESDSWQERQVRNTARAILPALGERVEQLKHRDMLLRPAFATAPGELLRPAIAETDPDPTQLLRPNQTYTGEASSED